jgi:thiol-disulfide isomerase/thioredoxin
MLPALLLYASLVNDVRALIAHGDLPGAARAARTYRQQAGVTPELAAALSWIARGELTAKQYDQADTFASEARDMAVALLHGGRPGPDPTLASALGASIEVHGAVLAARGQRTEAIDFLRAQLGLYGATPLDERIRKNINLLTLDGKPAPPLELRQHLGPKPPPAAAWRGHPVLLFFWAHWCPDCKAEAPVLARLWKTYGPQGLLLIGPTKLYGYVARGDEAPPARELQYIDQVRRQFYSALAAMPVPVSAENFRTYGASTTPTLVLLDRHGAVRFYHPGAVPEGELEARIQAVLKE